MARKQKTAKRPTALWEGSNPLRSGRRLSGKWPVRGGLRSVFQTALWVIIASSTAGLGPRARPSGRFGRYAPGSRTP